MSYRIERIEGIGPANAERLARANIKTTAGLLKLCCHRKGRAQVSATTGVSEAVLLRWSNLADLMRIVGVGEEYSELLEAAGVDTVRELKMRRADNLTAKMAAVNKAKRLVRQVPGETQVENWIKQANRLEPVISH